MEHPWPHPSRRCGYKLVDERIVGEVEGKVHATGRARQMAGRLLVGCSYNAGLHGDVVKALEMKAVGGVVGGWLRDRDGVGDCGRHGDEVGAQVARWTWRLKQHTINYKTNANIILIIRQAIYSYVSSCAFKQSV